MKKLTFLTNMRRKVSAKGRLSDVSVDRRLTVGSPSRFGSKSLLKLVSILALVFTLGVGNAWGTDLCNFTSFAGWPAAAYASSYTYTQTGVGDWGYTGIYKQYDNTTTLQIKKNTSNCVITTPTFGSNIGTITVTFSSGAGTVYIKDASDNALGNNSFNSSTAASIDVSASSVKRVKICVTENNTAAAKITAIRITAASAAEPHTVTFTKTDGSTVDIEEASTGAGVTPPVMSTPCDGWAFQGWSEDESDDDESTDELELVTLTAGKYYPAADVTLYPVYTKSGGTAFSSYTLLSLGSTVTDGKYLISTGSYTMAGSGKTGASFTPGTTESTAKEYTITNLGSGVFTIKGPDNKYIGGTSGSTTLSFDAATPSDNNYKWKYNSTGIQFQGQTTRYIRANSTTDFRNYTSSNGTSTKLYKRTEASVTYYYSYPNCCTELATINGSISWSGGNATVSWDKLSGVRASTPYEVSVEPSAGVTVNSIDLTGANATCSVTGLTAGTAYTFTINAYGDASHCDKNQAIPSTAPQITVKSAPVALTGSDYAEGVSGGGTVKTFTVSGVGLTGALTFTAPTNFQVSTDNGSTWSTSGGSKTLAASGTLAETTIKARLVEGLSVGTYGGATTYITISGGGAAAVNSSVSITGTVSSACTAPTVATPTLTSIASGTITVSCASITVDDNCDLSEYGFVWKASSDPTASDNKNAIATTYADNFSKALSISFTTGNAYNIKAFGTNSAGTTLSSTLTVTPRSVAFNMNGHGSQVATQYVNNGSKASEPSAPSASYYTFNGWKLSGSAYNFSTATVTSDITLDADWSVIPVTALTLNYSTLKKYVGESSVTLSVSSVTPNTANPAVTWTSSDGTVASVTDGGVVSFLKAGTATITATSTISGSITATCSVEVRSISSPTMQDEDETTISGSGLSATWTLGTRTLTASEGTSKYKFKRWIVTNATPASTTNLSTTLGDPTGNVTVVAEFYKPRTVTKGTGTGTSTFTVSPTGEVKHGSSVTVTCAATDGYKNPWTLTVTPSDGATYDETGSTGSITISNITKNITVDLAYVDKGCTTHKGNGVDEGSSYSNVYGPVNDNWNYGARQILYTKSDLGLAAGKKGTIKSISFQYQYSTAISDKDKVKIYMANTNLTSLSTSNYVTSFTEVYSGSMNCSNGWNEIELDTDFDYNGVGNLLVVIEDYSGKYTGSSYAFYYHEATTGIQLYNTTDGSAYDITAASTWTGGTAVAYRPNTKFCIEEDDMTPATVNWYVNGSIEHTQTDYPGTAFDEIPTPVSGDCDGEKEFVGWYTDDYTHASVAPAFVNPTVIPEGGADYYAVFATVTPTNNYQQITSEGDLVAGAKYLIVGNSSTTYNALPVDAATSLSSVSPSGTPLTISSPGSTLIWTLEGSADAWKIKSTNNNKYIQISSGSLTFETSTSLTFSVDVSSNIFTFTSSAASGNTKLSYYHSGKPSQFNAFSSANTVYVFKQVVTATNYATTCAETYDVARAGSPAGTVTGGTFTVSPSKQAAGKTVTLSATPDLGYAFGSWTVTKTESPYTDITSTNVAGNTLTMPAYDVTVNATFATLTGIVVKTAPTKTTYCEGDNFDPTGLVITASFSNSTTLDIPYSGNEAKFTFSPTTAAALTTGNTSVSITYGGKSTSQAITVNALRTITLTGSGTVTGGTFTVDNASACVGATITIEASAASHYSFTSWTIEKAGGGTVTPVSATSASTTFTMPDDNVTITPTFTEAAFKTVVFQNNSENLYSGEGYDATNKWKQKVYVGEAPVAPTALRDGYGVGGDACNDESTSFYGWTKNTWEDYIADEATVKARTAANTVYKNGATLATVAGGDDAIIYYHAVWAKGDVVNINNPLIVKWNAQEINSTPAAGAKADGTESGAKISSNVTLGTTQGSYGYGLGDMGGSDITITITGLDFSGYNSGSISFYAKASQSRNLTIEESSGGGYSTITSAEATSSASNGKWHEITGISNTTTSLKITYPTASPTHGTFYIGTIRVYGVKTGTYTFTKLTSENTTGWTTSDWDGYYIIANGTDASSKALNGGGIHGMYPKTVTVSDGTTITTTDANLAFQITYEGTNEYSIRGVGSNDYVNTSGAPVFGYYNQQKYYAVAYNELSATSSTYLRWNSNRFGVYSNCSQPTLYKILSVLTKFRTTCCEKHAITKGGATPGTVTGGTFTVDKATACENEEVTLSVTSTTTGYNFDHWQVLQTASPFTDYSSNVSEGVLTMPGVPVTVTAVFAVAHTTTVTLDKQEGTGGTNSVTATVNLAMPAADMPTRSGYAFGGYYSAPNGSGTQYYDADGNSAHVWDDGESDNATLYAKWTASGYTVTLNKEGATTQGTASVSVTFGANTNLTSAITCPSWDGKVFGGYWTTASGDGTRLIDQDGNWLPSVASYTDVNRNWLYANDLELHARWSNVSYTNYRTTCGPEITVTGGPVYLTSYAGCEVLTTGNITVSSENWHSTGGAPKFLSIKFKNMVTGVTYTHTSSSDAGATQKIVNSECRAYYAAGNGGSVADGGYIALPTNGTNPSYDFRIAYTPTAGEYNTRDHYIVLVEVYDNSGTKKTLTMETVDLYGRTLPEQFIIAAKKDGKWWALPNDLAGTEAAAKAAKAIEIIVDNTTTPTAAIYAPENTLYKAARYYTGPTVANQNRSGVRFTRNGSQYLQVSTVEGTNVMWLSATGGTDVQDWYLDGGTAFANYTIKLDPRMGTGGYKDKKMGIFGSNFGFYTTPTAYDIYLLPVETVLAEAEVVEWGKHSAIIEADAGSTGFNAASVIGRIGDEATTPITVAETKTSYKGGATKYNYTVNFGNTFDFTTEKDNKLYLDWLNGSGTVVATSMIDIPWIIDGTKTMSVVDGQKTHWSSAEVHVLPGAVLTADAETFSGVTIGTLEIYPGATVKVTTGTLNVSDLVLRYGWTRASGKDYNSAQLQIKRGVGGANLTTTRAYADWYIDYDQFYSMSVPWTVTTSNIRYRNTNSAANTSSVKIRYYDGENRAATGQTQIGQNWKDYNPWPTYLEPSKGYAISAKRPTGKAFSILRMPLTIPSSAWTALGEQGYVESTHKDQVSVTGWGKGTAEWYAMGWNFIGNPYMSTFNGDDSGIIGKLELQNGGTIRYATIPDLGFHNYDQVAIADANILPANGFFIQANDAAAQIVTFNADNIVNPTAPARFTTSSESVPDQEAYIRLSYEGGKDQMGLIIGEDYTENYEANADLAKVLGDAGYVKTYMQYGGMDMAYVAINEELAKAWIPVTVILPANGEYTYSLMSSSEVDELEGVYLIDYANDDKVTNLINENYTFTADAGTISNRFAINAIVGERQIPTDIDVVNEGGDLNSDKPFKFLYHEKVYIYHRGVIYDATGKRVKEINK